jgi:hypothetical protein
LPGNVLAPRLPQMRCTERGHGMAAAAAC